MFYLRRFSGFADAGADLVSMSMTLRVVGAGVPVLPVPVSIREDRFAADVGVHVDPRRGDPDLSTGASRGERTGEADCTRLRPLPVLLRLGVILASSLIGTTGDTTASARGDDATGVVGADVDASDAYELDVGTFLGDAYSNIEGCEGSVRGVRGLGADMVAVIAGEDTTCALTSAACVPIMIPPLAVL